LLKNAFFFFIKQPKKKGKKGFVAFVVCRVVGWMEEMPLAKKGASPPKKKNDDAAVEFFTRQNSLFAAWVRWDDSVYLYCWTINNIGSDRSAVRGNACTVYHVQSVVGWDGTFIRVPLRHAMTLQRSVVTRHAPSQQQRQQ
jgi:hypothetical protein